MTDRFLADIQRAKREKLYDILRRMIANPGNVEEVADEISLDWAPMVKIDSKGSISFVLGKGRKQ